MYTKLIHGPTTRTIKLTHTRLQVATEWEKICTRKEFDEQNKRVRGKIGNEKVFITEHNGKLYCLSNVCTHLKLPLIGRTAVAQGKVEDGCIECPFHKTKFSLENGDVIGDWAPTFPEIPFVGKGKASPLMTFDVRETEDGDIQCKSKS